MSFLGQTLVLYVIVGAGVAVAVYLADGDRRQKWFCVASAVPFWPVYIPFLLTPFRPPPAAPSDDCGGDEDEMSAAIAQADAELEGALGSLDGWAEDVLRARKDAFTSCTAPGPPRPSEFAKWIDCYFFPSSRKKRKPLASRYRRRRKRRCRGR